MFLVPGKLVIFAFGPHYLFIYFFVLVQHFNKIVVFSP